MGGSIRTKKTALKSDDRGPFLAIGDRVFRPDWNLAKDTATNRKVRADLERMGLPTAFDAVEDAPTPIQPVAGQRVEYTLEAPDTILVWYEVQEGGGLFLNWSDETAPDLDPPAPPSPAFR